MGLELHIRSATSHQTVTIGSTPITIGRHPGNVVRLVDDRTSRYHAVIEYNGNEVKVLDLGSRNGTRLNGDRITSATFKPGDVVKIGGVEIALIQTTAAPPMPRTEQSEVPDLGEPVDEVQLVPEDEAPASVKAPKSPKRPAARPPKKAPAKSTVTLDDDDDELSPDIVDENHKSLHNVIASLPAGAITASDVRLINARDEVVQSAHDQSPATSMLKQILVLCARSAASDVHIDPKRDEVHVRIRVDGMMVDAVTLHKTVATKLAGVIRILCDMDIAARQTIQEGRFSAMLPGRRVDYRVSITPSMHGHKIALRVLDQAVGPQRLADLGLPDWMHNQLRGLLKQDAGMLVVCGPTGSGKTTTLYAALRDIDAHQRNIITIEDPPEYQIEGVTQIPINEAQGNTFSTLLRSLLRQDPDVIMLGEIRDPETARVALQASMTGRLVFSTVHARDGIGTIFRLLDLGVEPYLIASALNMVLAQRLVRRLCDHCKQGAPLKPQQMMKMGRFAEGCSQIFYPAGCPKCLNTGFHGRAAIYELLTTNQDMRDIILDKPTHADLRRAMNMEVFNSLKDSGYRMVAEGVTPLDEIERVLGTE
ncbi:MAG: FHA domain-containing protein [Planctomycetes bacterium]|nr:FHA domain-containing protein [Planctomycetota bacterium]